MPYLLAKENTLHYSIEARIIKRDIYADDLITGRDNIQEVNKYVIIFTKYLITQVSS